MANAVCSKPVIEAIIGLVACVSIRDAEFQIHALHGVWNRRRVRFPHGFARQFEEPIVFVQRQSNVAGRWYRRKGNIVSGGRKAGKN